MIEEAVARKKKTDRLLLKERPRKKYFKGLPWHRLFFLKLKQDAMFLRNTIQAAFALLSVWIGIEFHLFMKWGTATQGEPFYQRPPGAEGFLPISALISFKYWLLTGIVNKIHPAGLFIFIAVILTALLLKKAFCGWLCPVGTLSESFWMLGNRLFRKNLQNPNWLDYPLRSLKYLLLFFFVMAVTQMDTPELKAFIYSPYNKVADIKMYLFFANISALALWMIIVLMALSVIVKNFWCRYLCPYGALLGALSWLSPIKITRNKNSCIDCGLCTKACPSLIKVHKAFKVNSDECMSCLRCVAVCPVKDTLDMRTSFTNTRVPNWVFGLLVAGVFTGITGLAMLTGNWQNSISKEEYLKRFPKIESPIYRHFRGQVPQYSPND